MRYYIAINNNPEGPFDRHELLTRGLTATSLVWTEGMTDWTEAQNVPELRELLFGGTGGTGAQCPPPYTNTAPPFGGHTAPPPYQRQGGYQECNLNGGYPVCPKTWLVESILVTIFCCMPFGIVGIVKASQVEGFWRQRRYADAENASRQAGTWTKVSFFTGLALALFYGCSMFGVGLLGFML